MPELPSGTLTVLHTEIEGSTLLTVHLEDRYPEVLATLVAWLQAQKTRMSAALLQSG